MGVPKFYRWISERYPCLSEVIKEHQIPDFDNLYLDMNGIIHTCSHPNDDDPHFRITQEKIFAGICHYLDFLFKMIKPKKVFFMAIDGVAPRAKMNQQRGRRFRTAKTAQLMEDRAKTLGEDLPTEARFDSNCITPGTEFMVSLHRILQEFVIHKVSTDKLWRNVRVYLSGHETPGEGEHKIMDFIRYEKSQPGYDPNTRHCLYGLDADLIMLGLCSHELYFSLLREEVKFGGKKNQKRIMSPEETTFHLLHISLLRDYLYHEFSPAKDKISFEFSVENIVDDFVLMSFLVGNDFIPNLPQLHIQHDALPVLFRTYMDVLPSLDGYINEQGTLNLARFEIFLRKLSEYDFKKFGELNDDFQYLSEKSNKAKNEDNVRNNNNADGDKNMNTSDILSGLGFSSMAISKMAEFDSSSDVDDEDEEERDSSDECDSLELELFNMHKTDYYMNKMDFAEVTPEVLSDQAEGYVRAIQWNLHYYYNGVVSWSWYYPHHYSPYISDVKNFRNMDLKFELGKPFLPFQQLLAVLPKLSKELLPEPYQKLMCDSDSPLIDYYPDDFETDLNGKQQEWEAVVLIPFINEKLLVKFATLADQQLSNEERSRNAHGPHLLYFYDPEPSGSRPSFLPGYYPALSETHFRTQTIDPDFFRLPVHQIVKGLSRGAVLDRIILGFPILRILEHTAELRNENVKVFNMMSQKDNMMLTIRGNGECDLQRVADKIVGKIIYVRWPHLQEAFVLAVSDGQSQISYDRSKSSPSRISFVKKQMTADERDIWNKQVESVKEQNHQRWGIFVGNVNILVHGKCLSGIRMVWSEKSGLLVEEKQWDGNLCNFALQTTISDIDAFCPDSQEKSMDVFSPGSVVFVLDGLLYGCKGTIVGPDLEKQHSSFLVDVEIEQEPDLLPVSLVEESFVSDEYMPGYVAAQQLGIEPYLVSHLTGTILIQTSPKGSGHPNRVNVGLNLKFNRKNEEVLGFTRKADNTWLYSKKAVKLIDAYLREFPNFFDVLLRYIKKDIIYLEDLYPHAEGLELVNKIVKWLKSQESASTERQKCGIQRLDPPIVQLIEKIVSQNRDGVRHSTESFRPQQLFSPFMCKGITKPVPTARFHLLDRVVNVSQSNCVPTGLRGTVIGISAEENESDTMYEIVFDKEFFGGLTLCCSPGKGYRLPGHYLINISCDKKTPRKILQSSPARKKNFNKSAAADVILKHLQSDNMISAVQNLQRKHPHTSPASNKPFYNVNEMFQTKNQDVSPQNPMVFSPNPTTETPNKQFVTPKAGYVASSHPMKGLAAKKSTPSPSQSSYQDFWSDLKRNNPESSSSKSQNEPNYGQKLSVKELFQSVENQKEAQHPPHTILQKPPSEPLIGSSSFPDILLKLCLKCFSAPPIYNYQNFGNTRLWIACISLPNGMKVSGVPCEHKQDAAASAAEKAVATLSSITQTSVSRNDLHSVVQRDLLPRAFQPPPIPFQSDFRGQILLPNAPFPYPLLPPFDRPMMRHPSPMHSSRIPDSFVAANQVLLNQSQPPLLNAVPKQSAVAPPPDPELFYIPGGGTARLKRHQSSLVAAAAGGGGDSSSNNLFVPNQVMKQQAVKAPFDSSGTSNSDWPDLPSKASPRSGVVVDDPSSKRIIASTVSEAFKSGDSPLVEKTPNPHHASTMTVLSKKPTRRRIAANFQNPYP